MGVASQQQDAQTKHQFEATVEPFWNTLERKSKRLGFLGSWKERRRLSRLVKAINSMLLVQQVDPGAWEEKQGQLVCNFRIDRSGVLHELREYAAKLEDKSYVSVVEGKQRTSFPHLMQSKERNAYYLPIAFSDPVWVQVEGGSEPIPVGSSVNLDAELESINEKLRVEDSFKIKKMVDFFQASEKEIARYESGIDAASGQFWVKFGFIVLQKLAKKSVQHSLPIVFGA